MKRSIHCLAAAGLLCASNMVFASNASVITSDQILQGSSCVGSACSDPENFSFDTLRLKSPSPVILFNDTSSSGSFPTTNWLLGVTDDNTGTDTRFFIEDADSATPVMQANLNGDVAIGAGAALEDNAISVGDVGNERRITHVADAVDDTDAVTLRQFNDFKTTALNSVSEDAAAYDAALADAQQRIDDLTTRVNAVVARIQNGQ